MEDSVKSHLHLRRNLGWAQDSKTGGIIWKPESLQQATADLSLHRRHSNTQRQVWLTLCGVSWYAQVLFEPSEHFWQVWGLILNMISPILLTCWGFSFALGCGVHFFGGIPHSPVDSCSAASFNFGVLTGCTLQMHIHVSILSVL